MIRIIGAVPIRQMAGDAGCRQAGKNVVFMTHVARHTDVGAGQRKRGLGAMVEHGSSPTRRHGVAKRAVLRKSSCGMIGVGGAGPGRLMA